MGFISMFKDARSLRTGTLSAKQFEAHRRRKFNGGVSSLTKAYGGEEPLTIALPGFTPVQAESLAQEVRVSALKDDAEWLDSEPYVTVLLTNAIGRAVSSLPRFELIPYKATDRRWEVIPSIGVAADIKGKDNIATLAFVEKRILRFSYPTASLDGALSTRRVEVRKPYAKDGEPTGFSAQVGSKIRRYSYEHCVNLMEEEMSVKHMLPELALELVPRSKQRTAVNVILAESSRAEL